MYYLISITLIGFVLFPLVLGEGVPHPPCISYKNKKNCLDYGPCAWCLDGDKCVDWDPCISSSDNCSSNSTVISDNQSKSKNSQCTTNKVVVWIIIIIISVCILACMIACLIGISKILYDECCPNCSCLFKRRNYTPLNRQNVQSV